MSWSKDQIDKNVGLVPALVKVDHKEKFWVWELIADGGSCFIICLEEFKNGGVIWTDTTRKCTLDRNTILKCEEGSIVAKKKGCGGVFLLLFNKPSEELMWCELLSPNIATEENNLELGGGSFQFEKEQ